MKINILTIFPEMFSSVLSTSILGRAIRQGLLEITLTDIRPYSAAKHKNTDDYPFGGGAGMVMMAQPILDAMKDAMRAFPEARRIYLGPRGRTLTTALARELSAEKELILLCGHYEGVDQRALDACIQEEISIGDYILTGGELAAMVLTDCVSRFIPGVLGSADSPEEESFSAGLLEYPQYTRPRELEGMAVPEVLLNGDHAKIAHWRRKESLRATSIFRPDLLAKAALDKKDYAMLEELKREETWQQELKQKALKQEEQKQIDLKQKEPKHESPGSEAQAPVEPSRKPSPDEKNGSDQSDPRIPAPEAPASTVPETEQSREEDATCFSES